MTEQIDVLEDQYRLKLEHACKTWEVRHPEEAKALRIAVAEQYRTVGWTDPEPDTLRWHVFEEAVREAIRVKNGWRSIRAWLLDPANRPSAPYIPPKLTPPSVEREDRMKLAAGDRE